MHTKVYRILIRINCIPYVYEAMMSGRGSNVNAIAYILLLVPLFIFMGYRTITSPSDVPNREEPISTLVNSILPDRAAFGYIRFLPQDSPAKCLDGSSPAYYFRHGSGSGINKWIVLFEGGGWCYDLEQCYLRSKTVLGSSKSYPHSIPKDKMDFYISENENTNPQMFNWNTVLVKYCDGGSYAGDTVTSYKGSRIHFRGKANREETIRSLFAPPGQDHFKTFVNTVPTEMSVRGGNMSSAEEIVIAGCSAGALGVLLGIDQIADSIRSMAARHGNDKVVVRGLVDSGFFADYSSSYKGKETHNSYGKDDAVTANTRRINKNDNVDYSLAMRDVFDFMNISAGANTACLLQHKIHSESMIERKVTDFSPQSDCIFAVNLIPHLKTPVFLLQPQYDQWQILHIFSQAYTNAQVNTYGRNLVLTLRTTLFHAQHPGHGAFVDSCSHHCTSCSDNTENTWSGSHVHTMSRRTINNSSIVNNNSNNNLISRSGSNSSGSGSMWNEAMAFKIWYENSMKPIGASQASGAPISTGTNWFFQDHEYPCQECCLCSVDMRAQLVRSHQLRH